MVFQEVNRWFWKMLSNRWGLWLVARLLFNYGSSETISANFSCFTATISNHTWRYFAGSSRLFPASWRLLQLLEHFYRLPVNLLRLRLFRLGNEDPLHYKNSIKTNLNIPSLFPASPQLLAVMWRLATLTRKMLITEMSSKEEANTSGHTDRWTEQI